MSFGYSVGDIIGLTQLAWKIYQNTRRACGEHDELTREVSSLHSILLRLESSASPPEPSLNPHNDISTHELERAIKGLRKILRDLDKILEKYNALSERERAKTKIWTKIRFGNGRMLDLGRIRIKIVTYMAVINGHLNVGMSEDIRKIQGSLDRIAGRIAGSEEGTVLSSYDGDDKAVWRELRRELRSEGFEDSFVRERKESIMEYVREIGRRSFLDVDGGNIASSSRDPESDIGFGEPLPGPTPIASEDSSSDDDGEQDHDILSDISEGDSASEEGSTNPKTERVAADLEIKGRLQKAYSDKQDPQVELVQGIKTGITQKSTDNNRLKTLTEDVQLHTESRVPSSSGSIANGKTIQPQIIEWNAMTKKIIHELEIRCERVMELERDLNEIRKLAQQKEQKEKKKMAFLEKNVGQLADIMRQLVEQNEILKKEVVSAKRKLGERDERIQILESLLLMLRAHSSLLRHR
jgi:hypothetical protein